MDIEDEVRYLLKYYTLEEILSICQADEYEILTYLVEQGILELPTPEELGTFNDSIQV